MENKTIKIVFATGNPHKLQEINEISKGSGIEFILPPDNFDPDETGTIFEENFSKLFLVFISCSIFVFLYADTIITFFTIPAIIIESASPFTGGPS